MPSQTRSSLETLTSVLVGDVSKRLFTPAQYQAALQEAQERFVKDTKCLLDVDTETPVADQAEYDLPTDIMEVNRLSHRGILLSRKAEFDLDLMSGGIDWTEVKGTPQCYYIDLDPNNKKFGLYPIPQAADVVTNSIKIEYIKMPPVMSTDSSVPFDSHTLLIPYHDALAYRAAFKLLSINPSQETVAKRADYMKYYKDEVADCIELFKNMSDNDMPRFRGGRFYKGL
jgi:hypothetical protein